MGEQQDHEQQPPRESALLARVAFTIEEVSIKTGKKPSALYADINDGLLRATRPGGRGRLLVTPTALEEYIRRGEEEQAAVLERRAQKIAARRERDRLRLQRRTAERSAARAAARASRTEPAD